MITRSHCAGTKFLFVLSRNCSYFSSTASIEVHFPIQGYCSAGFRFSNFLKTILFCARSPPRVLYAVTRCINQVLTFFYKYIENICFERSSQNNFIRCSIVAHSELPFWINSVLSFIAWLRWKILFYWTMSTYVHYFRANSIDSILFFQKILNYYLLFTFRYFYCFDWKHNKIKFIQSHNSWQCPLASRQYFAVMIFVTYLMRNYRLSVNFNSLLNR